MRKYLSLFLTMLKIGLFTFGGGYAMLALLENELVEKKKYMTKDEFLDMVAIAESTPGPIAINAATYIGYKKMRFFGSLVATLGVVFPSLIIITLIAMFLQNFADLAVVQNAFAGIRVCVCVLVFNAVVKLWKKAVVDKKTLILFLIVLIGTFAFDVAPTIFVIFAAVAGILLKSKEVK